MCYLCRVILPLKNFLMYRMMQPCCRRHLWLFLVSLGNRIRSHWKIWPFGYIAVVWTCKNTEKPSDSLAQSPFHSVSFPFWFLLVSSFFLGKYYMIYKIKMRAQLKCQRTSLFLQRKFKNESDFLPGDPQISPWLAFVECPSYSCCTWLGLRGQMVLK